MKKTRRERFLEAELRRRISVLNDCATEYDQMVGESFRSEEVESPRYTDSDIDEMLMQVRARADDVAYTAYRIYSERLTHSDREG
jgi:hypothetical protein